MPRIVTFDEFLAILVPRIVEITAKDARNDPDRSISDLQQQALRYIDSYIDFGTKAGTQGEISYW